MAGKSIRLDGEILSCPICLDLLTDPVTVPCGHNYCMDCINVYWDSEGGKPAYVCPQCRKTFAPRPALLKNTTLAAVADELKKSSLQDPADPSQAGPCQSLQEVRTVNFQGQDVRSAAKGRREKQRQLTERWQSLQKMIRDREEDAAALQRKAEAIGHSADKAVEDSHQILTRAIQFLDNQRGDVENRVRSRQEAQVGRVRADREHLELLIVELRSQEEEVRKILHTEDDSQFLHRLASLPPLSLPPVPSQLRDCSPSGFEDVTAALSQIANTLPKVFSKEMSKISQKTSDTDCLGPQNEPQGRDDFLKYSRKITLDAETAHPQLQLSAGKTRAAFTGQSIDRPSHPGRFTDCCQVLGEEDVTGRAYWEVKWDGAVYIAVAYADVKRDGGCTRSGFGFSDKSWALYCDKPNYMFCHSSFTTPVLVPPSTTLGVYLDHSAGVLSFHSVGSETMTLLHRVHANFTQPLRAGFWLHSSPGNKVEIVQLQ